MRSCNCTLGKDGVCCQDKPTTGVTWTTGTTYTWPPKPLSADEVRKIVREELDRG